MKRLFQVGNTAGALTKGTRTPEHTAKVVESIKRTFTEKGYHVLTNTDPVGLTADCSVCGKVPLLTCKHANRPFQYICWVKAVGRNAEVQAKVAHQNQALEMLTAQGGREGNCILCAKPFNGEIVLDHDHETGLIRGYLHQGCNKGIGHFQDDPDLLRRAASYLESSAIET